MLRVTEPPRLVHYVDFNVGMNEDDNDSIGDIKPKSEVMEMEIEEFTLPDTIEGVRDRFNKLYVEFMRHNKQMSWCFYWTRCYVRELSLPPNIPS